MITWRPIAELPDQLKDGREVLITDGETAAVAHWDDDDAFLNDGVAWRDMADIGWGGMCGVEPTHFAEINAPEGIEA